MVQHCKFFQQGRCTKGAACSFIHDQSLATPAWPVPTLRTASLPLQTKSKLPCSFFLQGRCKNRDECAFSHTLGAITPARVTPISSTDSLPAERAPGSTDTRSTVPCVFFLRGNCTRGDDCSCQHSDESGHDSLEVDTSQVGRDEHVEKALIDRHQDNQVLYIKDWPTCSTPMVKVLG